ncbi:unnamed protein product [Schistosoma margrebowiei]|uniref:Uncharacterized protein n=1 Tax=Schistosoma margrebowiei TaxID=48269 RepID=A0A183LUM4_9TREM|nr:unnamed protein product [Schistosoma margrebowiei]
MKLKLKGHWTAGLTEVQRFNTDFLRDTNKFNQFKINLNDRSQALQDRLKEALTSMCQEVLGCKEHHHNEWISIEILDMIQKRDKKETVINKSQTRVEKVKAQAEFTEANEQVNRSIRIDRQKYLEDLTTTAEKAATEGNMRQLYDTTKKLAGKYGKLERPIKGKDSRTEEQMG